jgi:rfaE bifunctional protein kinase chain/domain/rfaE bifunctional protein nucleotidyltransferase chain/domain
MKLATKVLELDDLAAVLARHREEGKKVILCHGVFDLLHPGHVRHFQQAKAQGDILVVTLTPDDYVNKGPGRPVFNQRLRAEWIAALEMVDYVAVNRWPSAVETIKLLRPHVFAKGNEFADRGVDVTGHISAEEQAILEIGGRLHLTEDITFSSTKLLNAFFNDLPAETLTYLQEFRQRHTPEAVAARLKGLRDLRVVVVGDAIIDEYHHCRPFGLASKSSSINARHLSSEAHAGGALAVANHVAGFARRVHLISCLGGDDPRQDFITRVLKPNVSTRFYLRPGAPTTTKRRFVSTFQMQKLFEVSFLDDTPLSDDQEALAAGHLQDHLRDCDVLLVADFGHGFIGPRLIEVICQAPCFVALNTQTNSSNAGFNLATKYRRADYVCLDEEELRLACHDRFGEVLGLAHRLADQLQTKALAVTRGQRGSVVLARDAEPTWAPVVSQQVRDTTGAGDAYLSLTALCAAAGHDPELLAFVGNCAGAMLIRELGNRVSLEPVPLFRFITTLLKV